MSNMICVWVLILLLLEVKSTGKYPKKKVHHLKQNNAVSSWQISGHFLL